MQDHGNQMPTSTSRAVRLESLGGPEALNLREVPAPQAGSGQIRVRVTAAGLNPMDWFMTCDAETASRFGLSLPAGPQGACQLQQLGGFRALARPCRAVPSDARRRAPREAGRSAGDRGSD
jgi:hypothetical protein